jgi:site-specific recombinase XerC
MINNRWSKNSIKIKVDGDYYKVEGMLPHRDKNNRHIRVRNRFTTRAEAEAHLQAMQDKGELYILQGMNRVSHLTAKEEADAIAAIKHLQAHGRDISIYEMAVSYVANISTERPMVKIEEAGKSFTETLKFQENSERHKKAVKRVLLNLAKAFPRKVVSSFKKVEIERWMEKFTEGLSATSFNLCYLHLHVFFNYCYNQEWVEDNPVSRIQKRRVERKRVEILEPEQVEKLFEIALNIKDGAMVPYLVFSIFCGMRNEEIMRLDWKDVNLSKGVIRVDGKNYRERPVIIPENARVWLTRYAKSEGRVRHSNHVKYWDVLKACAGYRVHSARMGSVCFFGYDEECKNASDKSRPSFPKNVMRHTGITFMVQKLDQNVDKTAIWAGNSPQIIHRHYLAVRGLDDEMTEKFYSILPPEETIFEKSA